MNSRRASSHCACGRRSSHRVAGATGPAAHVSPTQRSTDTLVNVRPTSQLSVMESVLNYTREVSADTFPRASDDVTKLESLHK